MAQTAYIVLKAASASEWLDTAKPVKASSAAAAIRNFVTENPNEGGGVYVAVPERSFRPITVRVEQTTVLKLDHTPAPSPLPPTRKEG
jgi:hypothetical protein